MSDAEPHAGEPPAARVDEETVRRLGVYAELPLDPARVAGNVERLEQLLAGVDAWAELGLAFRFEDGVFSYAPMIAQYRPEWRRP